MLGAHDPSRILDDGKGSILAAWLHPDDRPESALTGRYVGDRRRRRIALEPTLD